MSARAATRTRVGTRANTPWSSVAFIVESMLLLVFLVGSLAVLTRLFALSLNRSVESRTLDAANIAATSIAEHFAADPAGVQETVQLGDLTVRCDVVERERKAGVLYEATISVYEADGDKPVYELETSRYEGGETS